MRRVVGIAVIVGIALAGVAGVPARVTTAATHKGTQRTVRWMLSRGPTSKVFGNLLGTVAVSASDVWTVGASHEDTQTRQWKGHHWRVVPSPNPIDRPPQTTRGMVFSQLIGVSAAWSHDVWAVGDWGYGCHLHPLIEHWNGNRWSLVRAGVPGDWSSDLYSVSVISSHDAWASGSYTVGGVGGRACGGPAPPPGAREPESRPLIDHWNGLRWRVVHAPAPNGADSSLTALSSVSPRDIWAAGNIESGSSNRPLAEHWNGTRWRIVPIVGQSLKHRTLLGIDAVSANDVWAVGQYWPTTTKHYWGQKTLIEHWNGSKWSITPSPNSGCHQNILGSVGMLSPRDGWAFGSGSHCTHRPKGATLVEHWNGVTWKVIKINNPAAWRAYLAEQEPES